MTFPRNWLKGFTPMTLRAMTTSGAKVPPALALPAVTRSTPRPRPAPPAPATRRGWRDGPAAAAALLPTRAEEEPLQQGLMLVYAAQSVPFLQPTRLTPTSVSHSSGTADVELKKWTSARPALKPRRVLGAPRVTQLAMADMMAVVRRGGVRCDGLWCNVVRFLPNLGSSRKRSHQPEGAY